MQRSSRIKLVVATLLSVLVAMLLSYSLTVVLVLVSSFLDEGVRRLGADWSHVGIYTVPASAATAPFCAWVYYGIRRRSRSLAPYAGLGAAFLWATVLSLMIGDMQNFDDQFNWAVNLVVGMVFLTDVIVMFGFVAFMKAGRSQSRRRRHRSTPTSAG